MISDAASESCFAAKFKFDPDAFYKNQKKKMVDCRSESSSLYLEVRKVRVYMLR